MYGAHDAAVTNDAAIMTAFSLNAVITCRTKRTKTKTQLNIFDVTFYVV